MAENQKKDENSLTVVQLISKTDESNPSTTEQITLRPASPTIAKQNVEQSSSSPSPSSSSSLIRSSQADRSEPDHQIKREKEDENNQDEIVREDPQKLSDESHPSHHRSITATTASSSSTTTITNTNTTFDSSPSSSDSPQSHSPALSSSAISELTSTVIQRQPTQSSDNQASVNSNSHSIISNAKKFKASSLSVNKKFLSQSGTGDGKNLKGHFLGSPRLSNLNSSGSQASVPRLLTGKIGPNSSILNPSGSTSGWAKTPVVAPSISLASGSPDPSNPSTTSQLQANKQAQKPNKEELSIKTAPNGFPQPQSTQPQSNNNFYKPNHPVSSNSPWGKFDHVGSGGLDRFAGDFPTAQEVAQHTKLKAQSAAAANAAREKALQERAAASAAYNQQLLQTLDGFRGTHLDPNASHWDEMEDEDDMFGEVVEFGDGTQYKVTEVPATVPDPITSTSSQPDQASRASQSPKKEERFAEDYDRTNQTSSADTTDQLPPFLRGRAELKSLFNERLGKFEPYSAKPTDRSRDGPGHVQLLQRPSEEIGDNSSHNPAPIRSRGPLGNAEDTRQRQSSLNRSSHSRDCATGNGPISPLAPHREPSSYRTSLSQPLKAPQTGQNSATENAGAGLDSASKVEAPGDNQTTAEKPPQLLKYKKPDLDQLHRTEMLEAAERARQRRQEEELAREKERERAKQKALEIEAKLKAAAAAKEAASAPPPPPAPLSVLPTAEPSKPSLLAAQNPSSEKTETRTPPKTVLSGRPTARETVEPWRPRHLDKNSSASPQQPPRAALPDDRSTTETKSRPISTRPQPTILERPSLSPQTRASSPPREPKHKNNSFLSVRSSGPLPSQEEVFRKRETGDSVQVWKAQKAPASSSSSAYPKAREAANLPSTDKPETHDQPKKQPSVTETSWRKPTIESKTGSDSDSRNLPPHMRMSAEPQAIKPVASAPPPSPPKVSEQDTRTRPAPRSEQGSFSSTPSVRAPPPPPPQEKRAPFKLPEMSHLDTVMSRIKGALEADKEARAKAAEAVGSSNNISHAKNDSLASTPSASITKPMTILKPSDKSPIEPENQTKLPLHFSHDINKKGHAKDFVVRTPGRSSSLISSSEAESSTIKKKEQPAQTASAAAPATSCKVSSTSSILVPALTNTTDRKPSTVRKAARFEIPPSEPSLSPTAPSTTSSLPANSMSSKMIPKSAFANRDPLALFDVTRPERPLSPSPAWKAFTVKLGPSRPRPAIPPQVVKSFWNPLAPARVNVLSWDPPLANLSPRTLSRDDLLFRKKLIRGIVISRVQLSKHRIVRSMAEANSANDKMRSETVPEDSYGNQSQNRQTGGPLFNREKGRAISGPSQPNPRGGRVRGRADDTTSWRRVTDPSVVPPSTSIEPETVPEKPSPIELSTDNETLEAKDGELDSGKRRLKSKIPEGVKVAFSKPPFALPADHSSSSGMFMVSSEITGETPPNSGSKQSSPFQASIESAPVPLTPRPSSGPGTLSSSALPAMTGNKTTSSPWTKSPLPFSVLDSHTKNVWSQPDGRITTSTSPSGTMENSLKGIADDFPAKLPRTLNDFDDEEDPTSNSRKGERVGFPDPEAGPSSYGVPKMHDENSRVRGGEAVDPSKALRTGSVVSELGPSSSVNGLGPVDHMKASSRPNYQAEDPTMAPGQGYPSNFSTTSPSSFQVPPGYQLVPIGSVPPGQHAQYSSRPTTYPSQAQVPWSPSLPALQPNGYSRSPQLYSLNSPYPSPIPPQPALPPPPPQPPQAVALLPSGYSTSQSGVQSAGMVNQNIQGGGGFNKTPGPIAPRGSRMSGSSIQSPHSSRQSNENSYGPVVGRNGNYSTTGKGQMNGANGYPIGPIEVNTSGGSSGTGYGGSFTPFLPPGAHPMTANQFHPMPNHAGAGSQIAGGMIGMMSPQQVSHSGPSNLMGPNSPSNHYHGPSPQTAHLSQPGPPPPPPPHHPYLSQPFQQTAMIGGSFPTGSNSTGSGYGQHSSSRNGNPHHSVHVNGGGGGGYYGNSSHRNSSSHNSGGIGSGGGISHRSSHHR